ncbi:RagB/SusD family nutrient uptake outer membrane protein [Pedobacter sp. JY14-1]|uniref:RagB/SusD family nutrient uptake outer membrane protein n=1 Tax=Pedobacter sp. JY14-1 TaxID=3034151 RepID=UPI0023E1EA04|nr:RagB/SusD family nutrient uptake outer membrane protein [Pedobacter sp. JY14-1]
MIMKINYILFAFILMCLTSACKKALDSAPDGKLSLDDVFSDPVKTGAFLNSCYANMPTKGTRYFFWSRGPVVWSDEAWDTDAEAESGLMAGRMYNGNASSGNHPVTNVSEDSGNGNYWARYWAAIRNCTIFISRVGDSPLGDIEKSRYKAEAHLLRAFYYAELLKWFGPSLPIQREPYQFDGDFSQTKRPGYYELVKFIMEDCDAAISSADLPWRITSAGEAGRVNKAMAEAVKSRMMLFAASPLNTGIVNHWEEAYEINKASLANLRANGYELYNKVNFPQTYLSDVAYLGPDKNVHSAVYNEYFTRTMEYSGSPVDKETIYQSRDGQGNIWNIDGIGAQDGYKSGTCPSQELVDAYETKDGQPVLDLANPYADEKHTQPNYNPANSLYDERDPYANRDPRFYASIYYNGSKRKALWGFSEEKESYENYPAAMGNRTRIIATYVGEPQTGIHPTTRKATRTGYFERKFLHPNSGNDNVVGGANWKFFRLGEVILNFAETALETNRLDEARQAINEIRLRAGMPELPLELNQEQLRLRLRNERRVELAMEEARYFDVRRWTQPGGDLSKTDKWITAMAITRNADGSYTYNRRPVRATERSNYTNKFLWVPIPLSEANRLKAVTGEEWQSAGW